MADLSGFGAMDEDNVEIRRLNAEVVSHQYLDVLFFCCGLASSAGLLQPLLTTALSC